MEFNDWSREDNVYMAKVLEQAERYDEVNSWKIFVSLVCNLLTGLLVFTDVRCYEGDCEDGH
jgi:hypothetical protein